MAFISNILNILSIGEVIRYKNWIFFITACQKLTSFLYLFIMIYICELVRNEFEASIQILEDALLNSKQCSLDIALENKVT